MQKKDKRVGSRKAGRQCEAGIGTFVINFTDAQADDFIFGGAC